MKPNADQERLALRAAVAWAVYLADAQGNAVIAAYLSEALHQLDGSKLPDAKPRPSPPRIVK